MCPGLTLYTLTRVMILFLLPLSDIQLYRPSGWSFPDVILAPVHLPRTEVMVPPGSQFLFFAYTVEFERVVA